VIGTVAYMAPEQIADAKRVDARADLWSVGMILYEMLTRTPVFGVPEDPAHISKILTKPPAPLAELRPGLPPKLEAAVMRCLEKSAAARFQSAAELCRALAPFASARGRAALEAAKRVGPATGLAVPNASRRSVRTRRSKRKTMAIVVPVVALAIGLALGIIGGALFVLTHR
jgi:serine/threonine-protein kinase